MTAAPSTVERARFMAGICVLFDGDTWSVITATRAALLTENCNLRSDLATAEAHPAPDWREFQDLIWLGRLEDTLRAGVAW